MCQQGSRAEQHLRLAANRDRPAQQACDSVRPPSLLETGVHFCDSAREQASCAGGCYAEHGMREGEWSARCMCRQGPRAEQHLRLAANQDRPAQQACDSVLPLNLLGALVNFLQLCEVAGTLRWWLPCRAWHAGGRAECMLHVLTGMSSRTASQAHCQPRSACSAGLRVCMPLRSAGGFCPLLQLCEGADTLCRAWHAKGRAECMLHVPPGTSTRTASRARCQPRSACSADLRGCAAPRSSGSFGPLFQLCQGTGTLCWGLPCRAWHAGGQAECMLHMLAGMSSRTASQARCQPRSASSADLRFCTAPCSARGVGQLFAPL